MAPEPETNPQEEASAPVAVVGTGYMGGGIAQTFALAGDRKSVV